MSHQIFKLSFISQSHQIKNQIIVISLLILPVVTANLVFSIKHAYPHTNDSLSKSRGHISNSKQASLFPYKRQVINISEYFSESNLKFDAAFNPAGIFTSDDNDTSTFSDANARQELSRLHNKKKKSLISYIDEGDPDADPIILFHGIPTYSFEWRNIIPILAKYGRVIAFDQIGQGFSSKHKKLTYTYKQHLAYVEAFFKALGLDQEKLTLVATDTGGSLTFAYAMRHPNQIKGLAFFETVFGPVPTLEAMTNQAQIFRTPQGNKKIIYENTFIENLIVNSSEIIPPNENPFSIRSLSKEEIKAYKKPYRKKSNRRVLAQWVNELPFVGGARDGLGDSNFAIWNNFMFYLMTSTVPKLYFFSEPGVLNTTETTDFVLNNFNAEGSLDWSNLGVGFHLLLEDYPEQIGQEIADWYQDLP